MSVLRGGAGKAVPKSSFTPHTRHATVTTARTLTRTPTFAPCPQKRFGSKVERSGLLESSPRRSQRRHRVSRGLKRPGRPRNPPRLASQLMQGAPACPVLLCMPSPALPACLALHACCQYHHEDYRRDHRGPLWSSLPRGPREAHVDTVLLLQPELHAAAPPHAAVCTLRHRPRASTQLASGHSDSSLCDVETTRHLFDNCTHADSPSHLVVASKNSARVITPLAPLPPLPSGRRREGRFLRLEAPLIES